MVILIQQCSCQYVSVWIDAYNLDPTTRMLANFAKNLSLNSDIEVIILWCTYDNKDWLRILNISDRKLQTFTDDSFYENTVITTAWLATEENSQNKVHSHLICFLTVWIFLLLIVRLRVDQSGHEQIASILPSVTSIVKNKCLVANRGIQDRCFVLVGTRELDVPVF